MASVSNKKTVQTVGDLRALLSDYPQDAHVSCSMDSCVTVYLCTPDEGECSEGPYVELTGRDPWGDDDLD
jgi:hypothetical protein